MFLIIRKMVYNKTRCRFHDYRSRCIYLITLDKSRGEALAMNELAARVASVSPSELRVSALKRG